MPQIQMQSSARSTSTPNALNTVDQEAGLGPDAMQVQVRNRGDCLCEKRSTPSQPALEALHPHQTLSPNQPVRHLVGDGHGVAKFSAMFFGLAGFVCGYGFSTMAGEQLLLSVPSYPFNPSGQAQRTLATALVGFNLPLGIAGLGVGAAIGAALGALVDGCVQS